LQICPRGLYNLYTYDIPNLGPHIGSGKFPQKVKKKTFMGKKGRKPSGEQQRRIPILGWTEAIDEEAEFVMCNGERRGDRCSVYHKTSPSSL